MPLSPEPSGSRVERPSPCEMVFSRLLDAPRELVWRMWSELEHIHEWYGPEGFTTTTFEFNFVPGGVWRHIMHGPDGTDYPTRITFREIEPPSRLVYDNGWDLPDTPLEFRVVVTLEAVGSRTALSLHMTFPSTDAVRVAVERYGVLEGGTQTLDRLARAVESPDGAVQRSAPPNTTVPGSDDGE
ncbi:MAG TPA: SRPBCC domain-containing protein [Gemmatimonadales bacterium]|nr:SRPBCC domain-containing protein [Gemmatimonadales bacterium]